jgi:HSP20 family protein
MDEPLKTQEGVRFPELRRSRRSLPGVGLPPGDLSANPFSLMQRMTEEMDRMFAQFSVGKDAGQQTGYWSPALEVFQSDSQLKIVAELAGVAAESLSIEIADEGLILQGERNAGRFYRLVPLPEHADADQANATFQNGVLEVTMPIRQAHRRRQAMAHGLPYRTYLDKNRVLAAIRETFKDAAPPA